MWLIFGLLFIECVCGTSISILLNGNLQVNENIAICIVLINVLFSMFIFYKISKGDKVKFLILFFALIARVFTLFFDLNGRSIMILPNSGADSEGFHAKGLLFPSIEFTKNPYAFIVGFIYTFLFNSRIIAQYINVLLGLSTIRIIEKILDEFKVAYKVKILILAIIAFIPNYIIMSSILLRESINIFLIAASLLFFVRWWNKKGVNNFIIALILGFGAALFHSGALANPLGYIIIFTLCNNKSRKFKLNIKSGILIAIASFLIIGFMNSPNNPFMQKFNNINDVGSIVKRTSAYSDGGSGYEMGEDVETFGQLLANSPIRMFYFLTSPLPWTWRGLSDVIAFVFSGLFYMITILYSIRILLKDKNYDNRSFIKACLILGVLGAFVFAWGTSNAGSALRHRDKFIANYIVMLALALDYSSKCKKLNNFKDIIEVTDE